MALHFLVGVGFLAGPFIVGRHFPVDGGDEV